MSVETKTKEIHFNGTGDVEKFIAKVELRAAIKGYDSEKTAHCLAERLEGPAFDVYMRLSTDDRKDKEKVKKALLIEFKKEQRDRETAIFELHKRKRLLTESPETYAYKLSELVNYAYPAFDQATRDTIAKDYFVQGLAIEMQVALKSLSEFKNKSINDLATETTRLKVAGVCKHFERHDIHEVVCDTDSIVDQIVNKVTDKLNLTCGGEQQDSVNYVNNNYRAAGASNKNTRRLPYRSQRGGKFAPKQMKCRSCQSTEHLFRSCPVRYCQACGKKGHDAWDKVCENYQ